MKNGLSIVIITYNRKNELKQTLGELHNEQCSFPWEIIVVDQNSTDGTPSLEELKDDRIRYIRLDKNLGVAGGRNVGASHCAYEYMFFIDDDTSIAQGNSLKRIYSYVSGQDKYSMFAFQIRNLEDGLYNWPYGKEKINMVNDMFDCKFYIGCGHIIKKSFFDQVNGYSDSLFFWGEETELILKSITVQKFPVRYNGELKLVHRVHGDGRNGDANRFYYQVRNRFFLIRTYYPFWSKVFYSTYFWAGYLVKGMKNSWLKEFRKGLRDVGSLEKDENTQKLTYAQLRCYYRLK